MDGREPRPVQPDPRDAKAAFHALAEEEVLKHFDIDSAEEVSYAY